MEIRIDFDTKLITRDFISQSATRNITAQVILTWNFCLYFENKENFFRFCSTNCLIEKILFDPSGHYFDHSSMNITAGLIWNSSEKCAQTKKFLWKLQNASMNIAHYEFVWLTRYFIGVEETVELIKTIFVDSTGRN